MTAPDHQRSAADTIATVVLTALAALAAAGSVLFSPFFVMATDACGPNDCDLSRITLAYAVTWGGVALATVLAIVGMVSAVRRNTIMWFWPAAALVLVVVSFVIGAALAMSVTPG